MAQSGSKNIIFINFRSAPSWTQQSQQSTAWLQKVVKQAGHLSPFLSAKGLRPILGKNLYSLWSQDMKVALSLLAG